MGVERARASKSLLWSCVDTFSQTGLSIVALVIMARVIDVEALGLGSLAIVTTQLLTMPIELLFADALIQRRDLQSRHIATAFTFTLVVSITASLLLMISAPWIAARYQKLELASLLQVSAFAIPFSGITAVAGAVLRRELKFAPLARRTVIGRVGGVLLGIAIALAGGAAWSLVAMYVTSIVVSTIALWTEWHEKPALEWNRTSLRELFSFALPNMVSQLLLLGNARLFVMLSGLYLNAIELGRLSFAFRIVDELRNTLSAAASQLAMPLFAQRAHDRVQFSIAFSEATALTSAVLLPLYAGLAVLSHDVLMVVFGDKWQAASTTVELLSIAAIVITYRQYSGVAANARGKPGLNALANAVVLFVSILLLCAGWTKVASDAALIWNVRAIMSLVVSFIVTRIVLEMSFSTQLEPSIAPSLTSATMCGVLLLLRYLHVLPQSDSLRLGLEILTGALTYLLALWIFSRQLIRKLLGVVAHATIFRRTQTVGG